MNSGAIHVLLVEHNPEDATLIRIMLAKEAGGRFAVESAQRIAEALGRLEKGGVDAVLLDLTLPDAPGTEAVLRLQAHARKIPIIALAGNDDENLAEEAMHRGAQDYIVKGNVNGRLLSRTIRRAIERMRIARELSDQRRRLDTLLNNIPDRVYFKDRNGAFIEVNPALARLYGFENPAQVVGKTDEDIFTSEHVNEARADEDAVLRTGKPIIGKMERETFPDGSSTWALTTKMPLRDETGAIIGTFGVSRDITELKTTEIALRSSEERYERLLDSVSDYVYTVAIKDGSAISTQHGPGCLGVTGYSPEEFNADPWLWHRIIHPGDRDAVINGLTQSPDAAAPFEIEHRIIRKDGTTRWVRNKHVPLTDSFGRVVSYDGLMTDITERKRAADELRAAQSQLMQLEKLHSIGQLAAGVAHEVKNPLQVILVGLQYLGDSPLVADEQALSVMREMHEAVQRANSVVQEILEFSSPRELGMQRRSVNVLIERALGFVRHDLKAANVEIVRHLDTAVPDVLADPNKIEQVFVNLLTNACHAMPGGGTLTVSTRKITLTQTDLPPHDVGDRSGMQMRIGETAVVTEIRDTGAGVPPDKLSKIFEPFFTTKSTGKGTGLGLPVCRKILELHRGKINIENDPAGGVVATVILRTAHENTGNTNQPHEQKKDPSR